MKICYNKLLISSIAMHAKMSTKEEKKMSFPFRPLMLGHWSFILSFRLPYKKIIINTFVAGLSAMIINVVFHNLSGINAPFFKANCKPCCEIFLLMTFKTRDLTQHAWVAYAETMEFFWISTIEMRQSFDKNCVAVNCRFAVSKYDKEERTHIH